jgi:hypothetical protein
VEAEEAAESEAAEKPAEAALRTPEPMRDDELLLPLGEEVAGEGAAADAASEVPPVTVADVSPEAAGERLVPIAAPVAEMLDVEAESPILPASDERED